jgi:nucleoside-diphosphate-sugar epimerase
MSPEVSGPHSVDELEELLSQPNDAAIATLREVTGDVLILGVGGKMGPTLARLVRRASDAVGVKRRVIGVSRFSDARLPERLSSWNIETISCDLLRRETWAQLPEVENVICMTGFKFGAAANPALTWAMNCYLPALVCERYRNSRIVVFSSGNVYGPVPVAAGGSLETDPPNPVGEYAITVLGRERMFEYFSREWSIPVALLRLNYATELRYGVLVDLASKVWSGEPIDLTMGYVNVVWQQEANAMAVCALRHTATPPRVLNIAGADILSVRTICEELGRYLHKAVHFTGHESPDALLNNATASYQRLGRPHMSVHRLLRWTADWIAHGGDLLGKPTHFESRDGKF